MFKTLVQNITKTLNKRIQSKSLNFGIPFFMFISIALFVLQQSSTVRYDFRQGKQLEREEIKKLGINIKDRAESLEEIYEKYKQIDINNWENKRIPRPWEETPSS